MANVFPVTKNKIRVTQIYPFQNTQDKIMRLLLMKTEFTIDTDMSHISVIIGSRVKKIRRAAGISTRELAVMTGVSTQQLSRYERGYSNMTAAIIYKLSLSLQCNINEFFTDLPSAVTDDPFCINYNILHSP